MPPRPRALDSTSAARLLGRWGRSGKDEAEGLALAPSQRIASLLSHQHRPGLALEVEIGLR
jgi:hypothetical protein